jgi:hypothetical protein
MSEQDRDSQGSGRLDPDRAAAAGRPRRLDPDQAAETAARRGARRPPPPVIDTRRYQRIIGLIGLTLVVVISVALLSSHSAGTAGIPAGQRLPFFAAPLAASTLNGDARINPPCTLAKHDPRALNICLISKHHPLVLAFFVTSSGGCVNQVSALQTVSHQFSGSTVRFAAVAVSTSHKTAASAVRSHHWTIPVAFDADGAVGQIYGVAVCPIVELAYRGGRVEQRLIGEHWDDPTALADEVRTLVNRSQTP